MAFKCKIKEKEYKKKWANENKERIAAAKHIQYQNNKEARLLSMREWQIKNIDKHRAYNRKYYKNNIGKRASDCAKRFASKRNRTPKWLTKEDLKQIALIYKEAHRLTKETGIKHHVDHIIPLQGKTVSGLHVPSNLQILTAHDNVKKSNKW